VSIDTKNHDELTQDSGDMILIAFGAIMKPPLSRLKTLIVNNNASISHKIPNMVMKTKTFYLI